METGMDKRAFNRTVAALVVPIALQNLINAGVQSADVVMLGMVGEVALSAASLAGQVQFVMMLIFFGLASGASVLTAQYWGRGDARTIEKVMALALRISLCVAVVFALAALCIPHLLMRLFTPEAGVIAEGVRYLRLAAPGYLVMAFTSVYLNIMRSVERVVVSTLVYAVSLVVNVILNGILIFGALGAPAMGVAGAALATTLARVVECAIVLVYAAKNTAVRLRAKDFFTRGGALMRDFAHYALPTTLNELIWSLGVAANAVIIGHLGSAAVAANSVAQVTRQLATVVSFGVANAAAVMIGKALGANDMERAAWSARRLIRLSLAAGGAGSALILLLRPFITAAMQLSGQAKDYLQFLLFVMAGYIICQAFTATMIVGVFRGGGDTRFGLYMDIITMWGFSILCGALAAFVFQWPVKVVYVFIMADEVVKIPLALLRYRRKTWLRNVTR